jgi:hypothetical protein
MRMSRRPRPQHDPLVPDRGSLTLLTLALFVALLLAAVAATLVLGAARWQRGTAALHARLLANRRPIAPHVYDVAELEGLPAPVQRYFKAVLRNGQPIVALARFAHEGTFNMGARRPSWRPFTSTQLVITQRPGFDWEARIAMPAGLHARVHDAYVAGEGWLHAELQGVVTVADVRGTPAAASGELLRYLAEAMWYPTALLPSQGVRWTPIDDHAALATLVDGETSVALTFRFGIDGLIASMEAASRTRIVGRESRDLPWVGRAWNYQQRGGMRIPIEAEIAWQLPEGPYPYWRGRIVTFTCEPAR